VAAASWLSGSASPSMAAKAAVVPGVAASRRANRVDGCTAAGSQQRWPATTERGHWVDLAAGRPLLDVSRREGGEADEQGSLIKGGPHQGLLE
jgi:hypothetical protein